LLYVYEQLKKQHEIMKQSYTTPSLKFKEK